jgi:hypothetical protein
MICTTYLGSQHYFDRKLQRFVIVKSASEVISKENFLSAEIGSVTVTVTREY